MIMTMTEAEKYQARRQLVKLTDVTGQGKMSALRHGMEEVLTPRQKQLVHMYYIEQKPMQLIAEELGLDVSSVSRTLKRARRNLYTFLRYGGRSLLCELEN